MMGENSWHGREIVEEVRAARQAHAARFDHDLARIFEDITKKEQEHPERLADLKPLERRVLRDGSESATDRDAEQLRRASARRWSTDRGGSCALACSIRLSHFMPFFLNANELCCTVSPVSCAISSTKLLVGVHHVGGVCVLGFRRSISRPISTICCGSQSTSCNRRAQPAARQLLSSWRLSVACGPGPPVHGALPPVSVEVALIVSASRPSTGC